MTPFEYLLQVLAWIWNEERRVEDRNRLAYTIGSLLGPGLGVKLKPFDQTFGPQEHKAISKTDEEEARAGFEKLRKQLKSIEG